MQDTEKESALKSSAASVLPVSLSGVGETGQGCWEGQVVGTGPGDKKGFRVRQGLWRHPRSVSVGCVKSGLVLKKRKRDTQKATPSSQREAMTAAPSSQGWRLYLYGAGRGQCLCQDQ